MRELDAVRGSTHALWAVRLEVTTSEAANEWIDRVAVTGIAHAQNLTVGTLAEIGFARALGRYVVILDPRAERLHQAVRLSGRVRQVGPPSPLRDSSSPG